MESFGTPTAYFALLFLFPLTFYVAWAKRPAQAVLAVVFFGTLFGPEIAYFKLPAIPPLDKLTLPYCILFAIAITRWNARFRRAKPFRGYDLLIFVTAFGAYMTMSHNQDVLRYGSWRTITLPPLAINDLVQIFLRELIAAFFPFMIGRAVFRTRRDLFDILHFLVVAALLQSLFILVELRMSPQFHTWIYGYGAHSDFLQTIRWGGYRPMVFMAHGLALSLFMCVAFLASIILTKAGVPKIRRFKAKRVTLWLLVILIACKSTGAILYGVVFGWVLWKCSPRTQLRIAVAIAAFVALYPLLRASDMIPVIDMVEFASSAVGEDRAQSLEFRFHNEEILLEKARERIAFGWGGYGRRSIYDEEMGKEIAIADGHWIIVLGGRGVVGFVQSFGILLLPIFVFFRRFDRVEDPLDQRMLAGFVLIVAMTILDLIPNGLFSNYPYLFAGAIAGFAHELKIQKTSWSGLVKKGARAQNMPNPRRRRA